MKKFCNKLLIAALGVGLLCSLLFTGGDAYRGWPVPAQNPLWVTAMALAAEPGNVGQVEITSMTFPPGQVPGPGVVMVLRVTGLPTDAEMQWHRIPYYDSDIVLVFRDDRNQPNLLFCGSESGMRTFLLQQAVDGLDPMARCDFDYGEGDGPPPPPPPPPPPEELWGIIIYEGHEPDTEQEVDQHTRYAQVMASKRVRDLFEPGCLQLADKDVLDRSGDVPESLEPYIEQVDGRALPQLFLVTEDGVVLWEGVLPLFVDEMIELVEEFLPGEVDND